MATCIDDRVSTQTAQTAAAPATSGAGILFVDFQGASPLASGDAGDDRTRKLTGGPTELLDRIIQSHRGQTMKALGESFLVEFPEALSAVRAAMEIQQLHEASEADASAAGPRIGVHLAGQSGMLEDFGRAVHVAAGITKHAAAGQVLVSSEIQQAISAESDFTCRQSHTVSLDDGGTPIEVFEVQRPDQNMEMTAGIPPRYEVLSRVGTGGMGIVYKVLDREINDIVALKVLKAGIADDPAMQENLRREVTLARKVTHKNVCRIYEFNRSESMAYLSMEFIEGESLLAKLRNGPLSWHQAQLIARQICSGLREAHAQGIVHRDLKPANIMVDSSGTVKITDFGIARVFQGTGQMTGTLVGTPAYMAPEQVELKRIDERTDIYALGLLLYEIVTAVRAFSGDTPIAVAVKQLREFPKRPRLVVPALPAHAEAIILKCLHKDPTKRFQSVDELALALGTPAQAPRRKAASVWRELATHLRRLGRELHQQARSAAAATDRLIKRQDVRRIQRMLTTKPARIALAALGGLCLVTVSLAVATHLRSSKPLPIESSATAPGVHDAVFGATVSSGSDAANGAAPAASRTLSAYSVDLAYSQVGTQKISALASSSKPATKPADKSLTAAPKADVHKVQPADLEAAASRPGPSVTAAANAPVPEAPAPAPAKAASIEAPTPTPAPASASNSVPSAAVSEAKQNDSTQEDPAQTDHFFSVGSFKDSMWADEAVGKLVQLGFPAISVHKKALWIQSYEVRVGPYANAQDLEAAGKQLRDFGFKPHQVK